ncbi:MAG: efflux RND transporter periplasmic adaptor subunit [Oscillospiraceae bacterium]|nr:efflux RND transporter periplasmic adaptor subunit [Oscillospiraceae bacterium]
MKKRIISVVLIAALILSLAGCSKKEEATSGEPVSVATNVTVYNVGAEGISSTVIYTGEITPSEEVSVSAKISGTVTKVYVEEGQYVNAGDTLFAIDDENVELQYRQALASYNSAKANYDRTVSAGAQQSETQVTQAYNAAMLELDAAQTSYYRELELYQSGANVTTAELAYNDAVDAYNREKQMYDAQSNVILAQTAYDNALANYNRTKELYDNDTSVIAARNSVKDAEDNLGRIKELFNMGAATQLDVDNASTAAENARANLQSMESSQKTQLDSAQAALTQAEENLRTTNTNSTAAVDAAYSAMRRAEENLNTVRTNAKASLDAAESRLKNAQNSVSAAKENMDLTINVVNPQNNKTAKASVDQAKAALDMAKSSLDDAVVKAPISGYVSSKNVSEGQLIMPNSPLITLENAKSVNAQINVTESVISQLELGTPALISVQAAELENIQGNVSMLNTTKNNVGMYTVQVNIANENDEIKIGMFADITLTVVSLSDAITVPSDAVMQKSGEKYVYVKNGDIAEKRVIVEGISDDEKTQIIEGLNEGDVVIVKGKEYLSEKNNKITVVEE